MLTERLAYDVETARQWCVPKAALSDSRRCGSDRGGEGLFRVDELRLGFGQSRGESGKRVTGSLHGSPPSPTDQSLPRRISNALPVPHDRSPLWHPHESAT